MLFIGQVLIFNQDNEEPVFSFRLFAIYLKNISNDNVMGLSEDIKQSKFESEFEKVVVNLMFTSNWLNQKEFYLFKPFGLTVQQYNALRILRGRYPQAMTINAIIQRMLDRMSNASRIVDKLVDKGLVSREMSDADRRTVDVVITQEGLLLLSEVDKELTGLLDSLNVFEAEECEKVNLFLDKFRSSNE